ncbi:MAG: hypothetical protein H7263_14565 [Candidatus Sericytochromatia bacterium]|nr:hypothetical protein [Candidatus Sericytochromatia bacterium]
MCVRPSSSSPRIAPMQSDATAVRKPIINTSSVATKVRAIDTLQTVSDDTVVAKDVLVKTKTAANFTNTVKTIATVEQEINPIASNLSFGEKLAKKSDRAVSLATKISNKPIVSKVTNSIIANKAMWDEAKVAKSTGFVKEVGALNFLNKGIGAAGVITGGIQAYQGAKQYSKGEHYEGGYKIAQGTVGVIGGAALMTGAVVGGVAIAPIAATVGIVLAVGKYGNDKTKEMGMFKNAKGQNETALHHIRTVADETNKSVTKKHGKLAGAAATNVAVHLQVGISAIAITGAAVSQGAKAAGKALQNGGKSVQHFANNMDAKANQLKHSSNFVAKTAGYAGAVVIAKTSKAVGVAVESTGKALTYVGNKVEHATVAAVNYAQNKAKQISEGVGNTVGAVSNGITGAWNYLTK